MERSSAQWLISRSCTPPSHSGKPGSFFRSTRTQHAAKLSSRPLSGGTKRGAWMYVCRVSTCSSCASPRMFSQMPSTASAALIALIERYLSTPQRATHSSTSEGIMPSCGSWQPAQKAAFACGTEKRTRWKEPSAISISTSEKSSSLSSASTHGSISIVSLPPDAISHHWLRSSRRFCSVSWTTGSTSVVVLNSAALSRRASLRICAISSARQSGRGESASVLKAFDSRA
mmetsp:Transcript_46068/g.127965  ORF Transcript_46068/g.127965 Transcript_46068/m.127965 type:complete len:230 (-) Transcript_46068:755-1444(-)